ncbi:MAG TPA: TIGR03089 family protein [Candidatus Dietzia intestinigallinarum]|nr:TIGR03089 family protein [Candidatus Dietzia intestinigallinarum]
MNTAADTVFQPLLAADPGAPMVTHYDLAAPSRIELSVTSTANWAAKIAGLLRDEVGVVPGDVVVCDLPAHWLTAGVLTGAWWAGAEVSTRPVDDAVVVVTTPDRVDRHSPDVETLLMTTDPMGRPLAATGVEVPIGVTDLAEACRIHPDAFVPSGAGPLALDGVALAELVDAELAARVLVPGPDRDDIVTLLARIFASGGTAVLVTGAGPDDDDVADVAATERTTVTL